MTILDKLFKREDITGGTGCPPYLHRWQLLHRRMFSVYLHKFVADDPCLELHDHPKRFISIGLSGGYIEESPGGTRVYRAPWIRTFPAEHCHRIRLVDGQPCWTLVIVLWTVRPWGFIHEGRWIPWRQYVESGLAEQMKACP